MKTTALKINKPSPFQIFVMAVCLAVIAVVVAALFIAGSPADQRIRRLDETRVNDLRQLHYAIDSYYADRVELPKTLDDLKDPRYGAYNFADPDTGIAYEYQLNTKINYQLCATFTRAAEDTSNANTPIMPKPIYSSADENFYHQAGRTCFSFTAGVSQLGSCGPNWSCPTGNECVALPNAGQRCVPIGKGCELAGCLGSCVVAESYPPQIRCSNDNQPSDIQQPPADQNTCALYKPTKGGALACYGCANGRCSSAPAGWSLYTPTKDSAGIPYACYAGENGCELAQ